MELEAVRKSLESAAVEKIIPTATLDSLPSKFFKPFVLQGLRVDLVAPGRLLCSLAVPPRLLNTGKFLHGGATASLVDLVGSAAFYTAGAPTSGAPLELSISYLNAAFLHNTDKLLHDNATASLVDLVGPSAFYIVGASMSVAPLELNISYLYTAFVNEDIEIEAKVLRAGRVVGVATVELRKKKNGKIIAQGRLTKYLGVTSKL